jgi:hypothetical protein
VNFLRELNRARRAAYRGARVAGDVNAVARGPAAVGKRIARKTLWKAFARIVRF